MGNVFTTSRMATRTKELIRDALLRRNLALTRNPAAIRLNRLMDALAIDTVLDVGANAGQFGVEVRRAGFRGRIYSFEPGSDAYFALAATAGTDSAWTAHRTAIGAATGERDLNLAANSYSSSLMPMLSSHTDYAPDSEYVSIETVPIMTLDDFVQANGLADEPSLLKIDVQGYETHVLDGAADALATCVRLLKIELSLVELYDGQELYDVLIARLERLGYRMCGLEPGFMDPGSGRVLQFDGVFAPRSVLDAMHRDSR